MKPTTVPGGGQSWQTKRGRLAIWTPATGFVVAQLSGHGEVAFAAPVEVAVERSLVTAAELHLFFDAEGLAGYDSALRTRLTTLFLARKASILDLQVLVHSKIVAMGVSVANLALGGIVKAHRERAGFTQFLETALSNAGVTGFSTLALEQGRPEPRSKPR